MQKTIRVLDLFCGAGGSSVGIERAFDEFPIQGKVSIVGVDIIDQPDYPFEFHKQSVFDMLPEQLKLFDFIWASPPRQAFDWAPGQFDFPTPDLVEQTRRLLISSCIPFALECDQPKAPYSTLMLCGTMFGLKFLRHRWFETQHFACCWPEHKPHDGSIETDEFIITVGPLGEYSKTLKAWQELVGVTWTKNRHSIAQAMPPVYSKYIFTEFLKSQESN